MDANSNITDYPSIKYFNRKAMQVRIERANGDPMDRSALLAFGA